LTLTVLQVEYLATGCAASAKRARTRYVPFLASFKRAVDFDEVPERNSDVNLPAAVPYAFHLLPDLRSTTNLIGDRRLL
jgi:hypothetical protein